MTRLPIPGSDRGTWGDILNSYLSVAHSTDGSLKSDAVTAAGGLLASTVTTKGDIFVATNSAKPERLGVGTNGQVLAVDSNQSSGVKWTSLFGQGAISSRPMAGVVTPNTFYFATDDRGGTLYVSNGSIWIQVAASAEQFGGARLGYVELGADYSNSGQASSTDIPGMSLTVTMGSRPLHWRTMLLLDRLRMAAAWLPAQTRFATRRWTVLLRRARILTNCNCQHKAAA